MVAVTRPKPKHTLIQHNLRQLQEGPAEEGSFVEIELAFRALPEYMLKGGRARTERTIYGAPEFWVVDPERKQVRVSTPDGHAVPWQAGQVIPLAVFGDASIGVNDIFAGI